VNARLICLRHAECESPVWDPPRLTMDGGTPPDPPLTERGRQQARAAAHRLMGKRPEKVFVSEALRSRQTAEIVASCLGAQTEVVPDLAEASMGRADLKPREPGLATVRSDVLRQWIVDGTLSARLPDGETGQDVALRMKAALNDIGARCQDDLAIIVGHVASLTVGVSALCHNGPALWGRPLPHATPFELTVTSEDWQVQWPSSSQESVLQGD